MTQQAEKDRTKAPKSIKERDMETLAESLCALDGFNVKYDFGHEVVEGYFGPPHIQRWYRISIDPCDDPDVGLMD